MNEEERLVVISISTTCNISVLQCIRFGHDYDADCMKMDELLYKVAEDVKNFCVIYLVSF